MSDKQDHVALWDAINAVVLASGGNAGNTSVARQNAVVKVERAIAALMRRAVEEARADEREECAKALDEHGRDRQPQYGDLYMQEVSLYARQGGSHPATVRFAARWLAAAIRARGGA